jgi:hypothetical protein
LAAGWGAAALICLSVAALLALVGWPLKAYRREHAARLARTGIDPAELRVGSVVAEVTHPQFGVIDKIVVAVLPLALILSFALVGCAHTAGEPPALHAPRLAGPVSDVQAARKNLQRGDAEGAEKILASVSGELAGLDQKIRAAEVALRESADAYEKLRGENGRLKTDLTLAKNETKKLKVDWWLARISATVKISVAFLLGLAAGTIGGPWIKTGLKAVLKLACLTAIFFTAEARGRGEIFNHGLTPINTDLFFNFYENSNQKMVPGLPGNNLVRGGAGVVGGGGPGAGAGDRDVRAGVRPQADGVLGAVGGEHRGDDGAGALAVSNRAGFPQKMFPGNLQRAGRFYDPLGPAARDDDAGGVPAGVVGVHSRALAVSARATRSFGSAQDDDGGRPAREFVAVLRSQVGVTEQPLGSNDGPEVRAYLAACGITKPAPWCAALLHWGLSKIASDKPVTGGGAWSPAWFTRARRVAAGDVREGDIGGVYFSSLRRVAHVVACESVSRREVTTIEGNTNAAGSREGDRVARKVRDREQLVWARWL